MFESNAYYNSSVRDGPIFRGRRARRQDKFVFFFVFGLSTDGITEVRFSSRLRRLYCTLFLIVCIYLGLVEKDRFFHSYLFKLFVEQDRYGLDFSSKLLLINKMLEYKIERSNVFYDNNNQSSTQMNTDKKYGMIATYNRNIKYSSTITFNQ